MHSILKRLKCVLEIFLSVSTATPSLCGVENFRETAGSVLLSRFLGGFIFKEIIILANEKVVRHALNQRKCQLANHCNLAFDFPQPFILIMHSKYHKFLHKYSPWNHIICGHTVIQKIVRGRGHPGSVNKDSSSLSVSAHTYTCARTHTHTSLTLGKWLQGHSIPSRTL